MSVSRARKWFQRRAAQELPTTVLEEHIEKLKGFVKEHKDKCRPKPMPQGKLRIFTDCAGLSSETVALSLLGLCSSHMEVVGGSEIDAVKRCLLQSVHKTCKQSTCKEALEHDIFNRNILSTPGCDLYIAGFPCPAYSNCGVKKGAQDGKGRGLLIFEGLKYIALRKPSIVILEQVLGFLHQRHARTHQVMKKTFKALDYKVYLKKTNSKEHGVPQSRQRCYIVAFRDKRTSFRFPKPLKKPRLSKFLDDYTGDETLDLSSFEQKYGSEIWKENVVLDIGSSPAWQGKMVDACPCLIRSRCLQRGYYLPQKRRRLTGAECARLQGVPTKIYDNMVAFLMRKISKYSDPDLAEKQVMGALGDSMSVNILMRVLPRAFEAAHLRPGGITLKDPWPKGVAENTSHTLADRLFAKMS